MTSVSTEIRLGEQGRLVIPAHIRRRMNLEPGETLVARIDRDQLVLEKREAVVKRLQSRFAGVAVEVSLVDELIAERRIEASHE
ncbi:MAG: AbrB/MazE/SpoVT family DNA-binding domain-containing protein [Thermosynechococcaceae cyanobacterium]